VKKLIVMLLLLFSTQAIAGVMTLSPITIVSDDEGYFLLSIPEDIYYSKEFKSTRGTMPIIIMYKDDKGGWAVGQEGDQSLCSEEDHSLMLTNIKEIGRILETHYKDMCNIHIVYFPALCEISFYFEDKVDDLKFHKELLYLLVGDSI